MKCGYLIANPAIGTAPKQSRVKQSRPELRFLTERELETAVRLAGAHGDLLSVTVGTGQLQNNSLAIGARRGQMFEVRVGPTYADAVSHAHDRLEPHRAAVERTVDLMAGV